MNPEDIEVLTTRVQNGILCYAKPKDIRKQLESEGLAPHLINAAMSHGIKAANVRLESKEID